MKNFAIMLLATIALVATAATASAQSVAVPDPRGDAPRAIDVTRIHVHNARHAVRIHLRFADLHRARVRSVRSELDVGKPLGRGYVMTFRRRASGGFAKRLSWVRLYAEAGTPLPRCGGLRLTWAGDRAGVRLPRSCMSKPHDERVRANVGVVSLAHKRDRIPNKFLSFTPWLARG